MSGRTWAHTPEPQNLSQAQVILISFFSPLFLLWLSDRNWPSGRLFSRSLIKATFSGKFPHQSRICFAECLMGRHSLNGAAGIAPVWLPVLAITAVVTSPYAPTPPFPCGRFL